MIRIHVGRDLTTADPHYALRDAASQALAAELARGLGFSYETELSDPGGFLDAQFTGRLDDGLALLEDLTDKAIEVRLVGAGTDEELGALEGPVSSVPGGLLGDARSFGLRIQPCPLALVPELADNNGGVRPHRPAGFFVGLRPGDATKDACVFGLHYPKTVRVERADGARGPLDLVLADEEALSSWADGRFGEGNWAVVGDRS